MSSFIWNISLHEIIFELTLANFHRQNDKLMELLTRYIDYVIDIKKIENKPKKKKSKEFKDFEGKTGIKESDIDITMEITRNIDNLLIIIANNRQKNPIKFK